MEASVYLNITFATVCPDGITEHATRVLLSCPVARKTPSEIYTPTDFLSGYVV